MNREEQESALRDGAGQMRLPLTALQLAQLLSYVDLLQKWGRVYNLTALRDPAEIVSHHLLDSLSIVRPLQAALVSMGRDDGRGKLLDVGSGAGLPGVVLAICCPGLKVTCVDTVGKKAAFVRQVAAGLRLANLHALHARVEQITDTYDIVCSRAFASLPDFVTWSQAALAPQGRWLAMKGQVPDSEIAALPPEVHVFHVEHLQVPRLDAQRCIVWMERGKPA